MADINFIIIAIILLLHSYLLGEESVLNKTLIHVDSKYI